MLTILSATALNVVAKNSGDYGNNDRTNNAGDQLFGAPYTHAMQHMPYCLYYACSAVTMQCPHYPQMSCSTADIAKMQ